VINQQEKVISQKAFGANRIVSIYQSHVHPIVRGKAGSAVEFGAKVAVSIENGNCRIEKMSRVAYNETRTLVESVKRYKERNEYYPETVLADRVHRNRENLPFCKENNIRFSCY